MTIRTDMEQFFAQHDVVFLSPPLEGWEGLPIGKPRNF